MFKNFKFSIFIFSEKNKSAVPDKYFVITNNEIVRVRYLIVYGIESRAPDQSDLVQYNKIDDNFILKWINRNKWVAAMITYAAILLIIGASNSRQGYYLRQFMHRTTLDAIDYIKTIHVFGLNYIQKMFG